MRKLALVAALAAVAVAVPLGIGSSHREAPLTALDPTADDTDVYAFTAKDDPATKRNEESALTVVANWIPFEDPAGGPNFYRFDDRARYYINIDNNGDGRADVRYRFKFNTDVKNNGSSFLYAAPQVTSLDDPDLFVTQHYDITRIGGKDAESSAKKKGHRKSRHASRKHRRHGRHRRARRSDAHEVRIANNYPVAPNNVGPKTMPDYNALANEAIKDLPGGGRVFVGQREDPFFVDLGATFDGINIDGRGTVPGNHGGGKDDLAGYSVHSIVLQIPEQAITKDGEKADDNKSNGHKDDDDDAKADAAANGSNDVVGVWASTERKKIQVTDSSDGDRGNSGYVQVSRLGNPLVNEVVIPLGLKDKFNRTSPADDAANFGQFVVNPELAKLMNALFNLGVKETGRDDIVLALLQGIPGLNQQSGKPVDTLKINLATPPSQTESRLGVLGGDNAGFPNGRRLADDVTDIELRVVAGALIGNNVPLGDGVDTNDKPFSATFPYVAPPTSGFDAKLKRENVPPAP
jgi:hypothetical protein